jgi:hypothetical protein
MGDWDRPGFVEGFCEALAKRVAELELQAEADMRHQSEAIRLGHQREAMQDAVDRWKRIEQAARDYLLGLPGSYERLRGELYP